jgi:hypothetical protein
MMRAGPAPLDWDVRIIRNSVAPALSIRAWTQNRQRAWRPSIQSDRGVAAARDHPSTIEKVIMTHLHYDHTGYMDRLAKWRFLVMYTKISFATGRCMSEAQPRLPFDVTALFDVDDVVTLGGTPMPATSAFMIAMAELFPSISLHVPTGRSASAHAMRVTTPRGPVLLGSGSTNYYANFPRRAVRTDCQRPGNAAILQQYRDDPKVTVDRIIPKIRSSLQRGLLNKNPRRQQ